LLEYDDQKKIYDSIVSFFGNDYYVRKFNERGKRIDPQVVVSFLSNEDIFFQPIGPFTGSDYKYGYFVTTTILIDIYTKDKTDFSGYKEAYTKALQLREHINKNWRTIADSGDLLPPIIIRDLSRILTAEREYRFQLQVNFLTKVEWDESDLHENDVYAERFVGWVEERDLDNKYVFDTKYIENT